MSYYLKMSLKKSFVYHFDLYRKLNVLNVLKYKFKAVF